MLAPGPHFPYLVLFRQSWGGSSADDFILVPHARSKHVPGTPRSALSLLWRTRQRSLGLPVLISEPGAWTR